jgi:molybdenum cofactor guanylyltransferase
MQAMPNTDAAGFILAGGQSRRMGCDKALLLLAGRPLIAHALATLREAGLSASIAGARSDLGSYASVIPDRKSDPAVDLGPLAGICAALASTLARYAVFLSVDMPLLPAALLRYLLRDACLTASAVTVPSINGFAQTFPAVLDSSLLPHLESELALGNRGCFAAFQSAAAALGQSVRVIPVEYLVQSGQVVHSAGLPAVRWFLNVNTPADLGCIRIYERAATGAIFS